MTQVEPPAPPNGLPPVIRPRKLVVLRPDGVEMIFGKADQETFPDGELCSFTFDDFSGTFHPVRVNDRYIYFKQAQGQIDLPLESEVPDEVPIHDQLI